MKNLILSYALLCACAATILGQTNDLVLSSYDWDKNPTIITPAAGDKEQDLIVTAHTTIIEFAFAKDELTEYNLVHRRKFLNSEDAVNENNRVYIPVYDEKQYIEAKARVILKDGTIKVQNENNIKKGFDEESKREFRYFAFEGLEVGSEVEYFYIIQKSASYSGSSYTLQSNNLTLNCRFEVISPWNLIFHTKSYNDLPEFSSDTTIEEKNRLYLKLDTIVALKREPSAYLDPNLGAVAYKLNDNLYNNKRDIISYAYAAQNIYESYSKELNKKEKKAVKKFQKDIEKYQQAENKYRTVEDYIKSEYTIIDAYSEDLSDLSKIYNSKAMSNRGAIKLFLQLYKSMGLSNQLVFTTNRNNLKFDAAFESYLSIREALFYLPELDEYMDPTDQFSRIGFINPNYRFNEGLFIEAVEMDEFTTAIATVKDIPELPGFFTTDSLDLEVLFDKNPIDHKIKIHRSISGYNARSYQPIYDFLSDENKVDLEESMLKYIDEEAKIEEVSLSNMKANLLGVKPMKVDGVMTLDKMLEKAGSKYLFKIGLLIGPQMELYKKDDEEKRKLDAEVPYGRNYERTMTFNIPEGLIVKNLDALNINQKFNTVQNNEIYFLSSYKIDGNKVIITIREYYQKCFYPKEHFEEYRAIINAAADFNKIVLVFEEKV